MKLRFATFFMLCYTIYGDKIMQKRIHEMSLIELILAMTETQDPELMNKLILEKTYRQYIPFQDKTFEELLVENGYRIIDKSKGNNK